jgi:hypothetical protein
MGRDPAVRSGTGLQTGLWSGPRSVWSAVGLVRGLIKVEDRTGGWVFGLDSLRPMLAVLDRS